MSDLQCPARVVLVPGAGEDGKPAAGVLEALRAARVVRVYAGPTGLAAGVRLAEALEVPVELRVGLVGVAPDAPVPPALDDLADRHLGEAIAVLASTTEVVELERDTAGWAPVR